MAPRLEPHYGSLRWFLGLRHHPLQAELHYSDDQALITLNRQANGTIRITAPSKAAVIPGRLRPLLQVGLNGMRLGRCQRLALQFHDEQPSNRALCFDAPISQFGQPLLIPDPYCLGSEGFEAIRQTLISDPLPPWAERIPMAFWRGSTTGGKALTAQRLEQLPRFQLCRQSLRHPDLLDARFTAVVQSQDAAAHQATWQRLLELQLLAPQVDPLHFGLYRWVVEIDGNVNSWGTLWKLLLGSCLLRVESPRQQWFHQRLRPYEHVVPVAADLSNLEQQLQWCQHHPRHCAAIASAGQALAQQVVAELGLDLVQALRHWSEQRR